MSSEDIRLNLQKSYINFQLKANEKLNAKQLFDYIKLLMNDIRYTEDYNIQSLYDKIISSGIIGSGKNQTDKNYDTDPLYQKLIRSHLVGIGNDFINEL